MQVLIFGLLFCGAFAGPANVIKEVGPPCPIDDPLEAGPGPLNATVLLPIFELLPGGERGAITVDGLSTLNYEYSITLIPLAATATINIDTMNMRTSFTNIAGTIDVTPIPAECLNSGSFASPSGDVSVHASGVTVTIYAVLFPNIITGKLTVRTLQIRNIAVEELNLNFGDQFTVDGVPVDWETISSNLPECALHAFATHQTEITEKIRISANNVLSNFTLDELLELLNPGVTCAPTQ